MTRTRYLLALAKLQAEQRRMLGVFATTADLDLVVVEDANQALLWLDRHDASVIVFDATTPKAERLCHKARSKRSLAGIPILAVSQELTDVFTEKLYGLGVDDVIASSAWPALIARLRSLPRQDAPVEPPKLGRAVVADSDRARCDVIGHVLANAGFEMRYAGDERVLQYYSTQEDVRLVVASAELAPPRALIERARASGGQAAWIVMSSKREIDGHTQSLADLTNVATITQNSPPDDLLFLANELTSGKSGSGRASERVLYGTLVAFRKSGSDSDDTGFTYNISARGMYIRTLAPPDSGAVWLELRPPRAKERVRLEGEVIWTCPFGRAVGASAPPGFAVRLNDGLGEGLKAWTECYEFHVGSKRAGLGGGVTQRPSTRVEEEPAEPSDRPLNLEELAQAVVGAYSDPRLPAAPTTDQTPSSRLELAPPEPAPEPKAATEPERPAESAPSTRKIASIPASAAAVPESSPPPRRAGALIVIAALGVAGVLVWFLASREQPASSGAPPASASSTRAATQPSEPVPTAPSPSTAAAVDAASAEAAPAAPGDGSELPRDEGWLIVTSSKTASVYSNGRIAGPTNQPLKVQCGPRYVRLGTETFGQWIGEGVPVAIACRKVTRVAIEPKP